MGRFKELAIAQQEDADFPGGFALRGKSADLIVMDELVPDYKQTKLESFVEAWINVFIGFWINFVANMLILPAFGFSSLTLATNFVIGMVYTVISVARSYVIRRWAQEHLKRFNSAVATRIRGILYG